MSQQRNNLLLRRCDLTRVAHLHVHVAQGRATNHTFHRAGVRHDDDVVLIDTLGTQSLRREHAGNRERHIFDAQNLADWIFVAVNLRRGRAANDANLIRAAHVLSRKRRAVCQRPLSNIEIICRFTVNARKPILVSGSNLRRGNNFFAYTDYTWHFAPNCFGVFNLQGAGAAPAGANAAGRSAAGKDQDHVFAKTGYLSFHLRLRAVADSDHGDDRADANDDPERGEHRTHLVSAQCPIGDVKCGCDSHFR